MEEKFVISSSPHIHDNSSTSRIMIMVLIALMPATVFGIVNFGSNALLLVITVTGTCILTEFLYQKLHHQDVTINDFSAAVTGLLLALNLPPDVQWWMGALGGVFAIWIVKQIFGGIGQNFMNPALGGRCFLLISFTGTMTKFSYDGMSGATPLALIKNGEFDQVNLMNMFTGKIPGTIGETSVIALAAGAVFLLAMKVINMRIPGMYLLTFVVFICVFGGHGIDPMYIAEELCGGGLMLGVWFMATDYTTSPITKKGQLIYGVILGLLTGLFRLFGSSAEGVSYAIIFANLLVPLIERATVPKAFGAGGGKVWAK